MLPNTLHFIQTDNDRKACPVFKDDSRITMIEVSVLAEVGTVIPKPELFRRLKVEAPDFLKHVLTVKIPTSNDRLRIPVIDTEQKKKAIEANKSDLEIFIENNCLHVKNSSILFSVFYERFLSELDEDSKGQWSKIRVSKGLPEPYMRDTQDNNQACILHMEWKK